MQSIRTFVVSVAALLLTTATVYADDAKRLTDSRVVLSEMRNAEDSGIPDSIWSKAECVVVIPDLKKAGFIVGGEAGSGVMACRNGSHWGAPIFMKMTKGSGRVGGGGADRPDCVCRDGRADDGADAGVFAIERRVRRHQPVGRKPQAGRLGQREDVWR